MLQKMLGHWSASMALGRMRASSTLMMFLFPMPSMPRYSIVSARQRGLPGAFRAPTSCQPRWAANLVCRGDFGYQGNLGCCPKFTQQLSIGWVGNWTDPIWDPLSGHLRCPCQVSASGTEGVPVRTCGRADQDARTDSI